jgi:hypothetical protein
MSICLPETIRNAIAREIAGDNLPIGHYVHPDDPSGRTALCGVGIHGIPSFGDFVVCTDCRTLRMADDAAPLR